ncbi:MAG: DUF4214 domain-containing protein [Chlorobiaceae bacterium]
MPTPSTSSGTTTFSLSGVSTLDPLLNSDYQKWSTISGSTVSLTYSFPWINGASAFWQPDYSSNLEPQAAQHFCLNTTQIAAVITAFQSWANVAAITFTQVADTASNVGDFRLAFSSAVGSSIWGYSSYPNSHRASAADIWLNPSSSTNSDWGNGSYNYMSLIHEIGHGLGLKHPGSYNAGGGTTPGPYLPSTLDFRTYSIMSYNDLNSQFWDTTLHKYIQVVPETPMVYDIAAIQYLYGANTAYRTGNDTYTFDPSHPFYKSIWDAGGNDTVNLSNFTTDCTIDLTPGHYSSIRYNNQGTGTNLYNGSNNLGIAFGTIIENATGGSGNDYITGNSANNNIYGGFGNDTFIGGGGNDTIDGGAGTDTIVFTDKQANYLITLSGSGFTIKDNTGSYGTLTEINVEKIQFADTIYTFDITPPAVTTFSPSDAASDVPINSNIVLTFSEGIQKGAGTIALHTDSPTGPVAASYDVATSGNITISGSTLTINPTHDLQNSTHYYVTLDTGSITDLAGNKYAGTSSYDFTTVTLPIAILTGTAGNDTFHVGAGNNAIDGGAGVDIVIFNGKEANYVIAPAASGFSITDSIGTDGKNTVVNIEQLHFTDHTLTIAATPNETLLESYRIYKAAFNRSPDYGGLGFWYNAMNNGATLNSVASDFTHSKEFTDIYGSNPTDSTFLTLLYNHVLGRAYDQGGYDYWLNILSTHLDTQANVLGQFSESAENKANLTGILTHGIIYEAYTA